MHFFVFLSFVKMHEHIQSNAMGRSYKESTGISSRKAPDVPILKKLRLFFFDLTFRVFKINVGQGI